MPCFIMHSQLLVVVFDLHGYISLRDLLSTCGIIKLDIKIAHTFILAMFNLDIFHYLLPHICLTSEIKFTHLAFLGYISAFYPILLSMIVVIC